MKMLDPGGSPIRPTLTMEIRGQAHDLPYLHRRGTGPAIVFLHGLGCCKEDCLPWIRCDPVAPFRVLAFDLPGCGGSRYSAGGALRMKDLVDLVRNVLAALELRDVVLVGHSMGGLIGLLLSERQPAAIRAFVNVEGNLAPEDCTFSRRAMADEFAEFETVVFPELKRNLASAPGIGSARYRAALEGGASARAFYDYARETVAYSDRGNLLERFLALSIPKVFIHGSENAHLTYLPRLRDSHCDVVQIAYANHFPFHDNPDGFAGAMAGFIEALPHSAPR